MDRKDTNIDQVKIRGMPFEFAGYDNGPTLEISIRAGYIQEEFPD
jgi:hypothetical protein